ncbi:MAG: 16S rRNA (guanine(966)-N(2))-methyltransferase RsmD [Candidatus Fimadaptatus sp.]
MRIVGGEAGGRRIQAPEGRQTRPTTERVREAVFSILGGDMTGLDVLDVFAGSGAMALEALSRGAAHAVLCDSSRQAAAVIRRNIDALGYGARAELQARDWRMALGGMAGRRFDVVFIDPPYKRVEEYTQVVDELNARQLLAGGALLVLEHEARTELKGFPPGFEMLKPHRYGDTAVTVLRFNGEAGSAEDEV